MSQEGRYVESACDVEVVDTVGAGDAFSAVMVIGYLRDWSLNRISRAANGLGGFVCSKPGATPRVTRDFLEGFSGE